MREEVVEDGQSVLDYLSTHGMSEEVVEDGQSVLDYLSTDVVR